MKVLILAGGLGTRLSEETGLKPKPMVEIGGRPILWHIMKIYSHYGYNDFLILAGYLSHVIKDYFVNYYSLSSDITVDLRTNSIEIHKPCPEPWKVTIIDTGVETLTGSRIKRVQKYIGDETFMITYGDGVANIDVNRLVASHRASGKLATMTAVQYAGRFGALDLRDDDMVANFKEKPRGDGAWINAGFFVCEPKALDYIPNEDNIAWEKEPLETLAHGFQTLTDDVEFLYFNTAFYVPENEGGLHFRDPALGIRFPLECSDISQKDAAHTHIAQRKPAFGGLELT